MTGTAYCADRATLRELTNRPGYFPAVFDANERVRKARNPAEACAALTHAVRQLGALNAYFISYIRDDATLSTYRSLEACDPRWSTEYARNEWFMDDPWLKHAIGSCEPMRASELPPSRGHAMSQAAVRLGFQSAVIVPAQSQHGPSRVGVLCLGSRRCGYFEDDGGYYPLRMLARSLALELNDWARRDVQEEMEARIRLTERERELLRYEKQGLSSKEIAALLGTEPKSIDDKFRRVMTKLDMPNRRLALRLAELYGLL